MSDYVQVLTTVGSEEEAGSIASLLVERRLAACVQVVGPIVSRYRWEGEVEEGREWQWLGKTARDADGAGGGGVCGGHFFDGAGSNAAPGVAGAPRHPPRGRE